MIESIEIASMYNSPWILVSIATAFMSIALVAIGAFVMMICISLRLLGYSISEKRNGLDAAQERERVERARMERSMAGKIVGSKS